MKTNSRLSLAAWLAITTVILALGNSLRAATPEPGCVFPPPGLVSWWAADGNANDILGGNPGRLEGGASLVNGIVGQAFSFDGTNSVVRVSNHALDGAFEAMTIEAWINPKYYVNGPNSSGRTIFSKTQSDGFALRMRNGFVQADLRLSGGDKLVNFQQATIPTNAWSHIAISYDGTSIKGYLNGQLLGTFAGSGTIRNVQNANSDLMIGNEPSGTTGGPPDAGNGWPGLIDELAFYNRALSSNEITAIYNAGSAGKCKPAIPNEVIYANDFEGAIGPEWSNTGTATTPVGNRRFLGRFGNLTETLTLTNLPPHTNLTVAFDLFIIDTWDGNNSPGPDVLEINVVGGQVLLHTTFQNYGENRLQAYPDGYPDGFYRARTGALEMDTLGYSPDAVYHLSFTFPHSDHVLRLQFRSSGLQAVSDESWGLDNVMIVADGPMVALTSPTNNAAFRWQTNLVLTADAATPSDAIKYVQFLSDHTLLGTVTNGPYTLVWSNAPAGLHVVTVRATDDSGRTAESFATVRVNGLLGEYFNNTVFADTPVIRLDPIIAFVWGGQPPIQGVGGTSFTARWTGEIVPTFSDPYTFYVSGDDRFRLWVDGKRIVDDWHGGSTHTSQGTISLVANHHYGIQLDFEQGPGGADIKLEWASPSQTREVVPASRLFPPELGLNRSPNTPVITSPFADGYVIDPALDLPMSADFFSDADLGQGQIQTTAEWEIWTVAPPELVWRSSTINSAYFLTNRLSNGIFINSYAGLSSLLLTNDYLLRSRHKDDSGATNEWGGWTERYFNTRPPVIVQQPVGKAVIVGADVVFSVQATNILPTVSYQWFFASAIPIVGGTNASLVLTNTQPGHVGDYHVILISPAGSITSSVAMLTVDDSFTTLAQSKFESDGDGWGITGNGSDATPNYSGTGGYPGGGIYETDKLGSSTRFWKAPAKYFGNKSSAYGGFIEFDLKRSGPYRHYDWEGVKLEGAGLSIVVDVPDPGTEWISYRIPLQAGDWKVSTLGGPAATQREILTVLASLTNFRIRGEFSDVLGDRTDMDNVRLLAPMCTPSAILTMRRSTNNDVLLEWPTNACGFKLLSTDSLSLPVWTTNVDILSATVTNSLNLLSVTLTNTSRYYRLRKD